VPFKITTGNQGVQGVQGAYDEAVPQGVSPATAGVQGVYYDSCPQGVPPATAGIQGVYYEACPQGVPLAEEDAASTDVLASVQDTPDGFETVCDVKQEPEEYEERANSSMEPIVKIEVKSEDIKLEPVTESDPLSIQEPESFNSITSIGNVITTTKPNSVKAKVEVRYPCDQCNYVFVLKKFLNRHKRMEHRETFPCDQCHYVAARKDYLQQHKASKHEGIRFPCDQCEYVATRIGNLNRHKETSHFEESLI